MNKEFWSGKRVFVTGHTGFKGGWLSVWLNDWGAQVKGYSLPPPTNPSFYEVVGVKDLVDSEIGDIRDRANLSRSLQEFRPEVVFHMAAQSLVRYSYADPIETFETNVMGPVNLLEAARSVDSIRSIVNITTDKCYENREWLWGYRENEHLGGHDPYSASKACSELVTSSYRRSFFDPADYHKHRCAIATARAGNVIGGGDWAEDRLIPDILRELSRNNSVEIRNPLSIRPWQHVLEPLSGYLLLAQRLYEAGTKYAEAWNFGPDESNAKTVQWIAENLIEHWGENANWVLSNQAHPHEARCLKLDCSKARDRLQWQPTWDLATTLTAIVNWQKAYLNKDNMHEISIAEIDRYVSGMTPTL